MGKVFASNPLSLSLTDPAFESWLRDSGYLEVLDTATAAAATSATTTTATSAATLTSDDFSVKTPSWTLDFIGFLGSYSFPSSPQTLKLRVQENVKRYARNYASLVILFFACSLYQMPLALVGLLSSLALWDFFKFCSDRWDLDSYPVIRQVLVRVAQCATVIILMLLKVQVALFCALCVSYTVTILHAAFRKLSPSKPPSRRR